MPRPPLPGLPIVPTEAPPVGIADSVGDDAPIEANSLRLLTERAASFGAPGMSASFSNLGSAMAPPERARPLGCWPAPRPRFLVVNPDQR